MPNKFYTNLKPRSQAIYTKAIGDPPPKKRWFTLADSNVKICTTYALTGMESPVVATFAHTCHPKRIQQNEYGGFRLRVC